VGSRRSICTAVAIVGFALVPMLVAGCKKVKAGASHESVVVEGIASINRSCDIVNSVSDTASARQAEQSWRAEAQDLRGLLDRLVALGSPSGAEKKRVNQHSQELIDASEAHIGQSRRSRQSCSPVRWIARLRSSWRKQR
jgi:hypothetical protein